MIFTDTYQAWRDLLAEALDPRYFSPEWLDWMVMSGRARLFCAPQSVAVAEIQFYPTGARDVHVIAQAGDPIDARENIVPQLEEWGGSIGCLSVLVTSREAWVRLLKPSGFAPYKTAIRKEL